MRIHPGRCVAGVLARTGRSRHDRRPARSASPTTATKAPIGGAAVTVTSPSQSATVKTDPDGNFNFISLSPDTYTVSVEEQGYDPISITGRQRAVDQVQNVGGLPIAKSLRQIGAVRTPLDERSRAARHDERRLLGQRCRPDRPHRKRSAVRAASTQAYSAIATVPGVERAAGSAGLESTRLHSRRRLQRRRERTRRRPGPARVGLRTDHDAVEPRTARGSNLHRRHAAVGRSLGPLGLHQPGDQDGHLPGYGNLEIGLGGPAFYHKLQFELSGATPDHNFTYYLGFAGDNEDYRYSDQFNGAGNGAFFYPLSIGAPLNGTVYDGSSPFYYSPDRTTRSRARKTARTS